MRISSVIQDMKRDEAIDFIIDNNEGLCIYEAEKIYDEWKREYMKPRKIGKPKGRTTNAEICAKNKEMIIQKYVNEQISLNKIGQEIDVPASTMGIWLRRWGFEVRGRAEQKIITHNQERRALGEQVQL